MYITKTLKVEKIGKKWLQGKDEYSKIFKVEINDTVKELLSKDKENIEIAGVYRDLSNSYGVNRQITEAIKVEDYQANKEADRLQKTINTAKRAIDKMLYCIKKNLKEYWYKNGETVILTRIEELNKLKVDTTEYENKLEELRKEFKIAKEEKSAKQAKEQQHNVFIDTEYYEKNQIIKTKNSYIKIVKVEKMYLSKDDVEHIYGGCFIDDEEDYNMHKISYRYTFVEATEEEKEQQQSIENKEKAELEKRQQLLNEKENAEKELCTYIYANSTQEEQSEELETNISVAELICELDKLKSIRINKSLNILYLLQKNWSDYDCWDYNNCEIGICKTCTLSTELQTLLNNYLKAREALIC